MLALAGMPTPLACKGYNYAKHFFIFNYLSLLFSLKFSHIFYFMTLLASPNIYESDIFLGYDIDVFISVIWFMISKES
jgi:hypothetical protein